MYIYILIVYNYMCVCGLLCTIHVQQLCFYLHRLSMLHVFGSRGRVRSSIWCQQRTLDWWNGVIAGLYGETWWCENMRMTQETHDILCGELLPYLQRENARFCRPISVPARIAITIWRLATNIEYRTLAELFSVGRSTVGEIVLETCEVIAEQLLPKYMQVQNDDRLHETVDRFSLCWGFPQTVGAIDGTHIPIIKPVDRAADYYNRKGY